MRFRTTVGILSLVFFAALGAGYLHSRFHRIAPPSQSNLDPSVASNEMAGPPAAAEEVAAPSTTLETSSVVQEKKTELEPCGSSKEVAGNGNSGLKISAGQWKKVMKEFHSAKQELSKWLTRVGSQHPEERISAFRAKMESVRLQRPPIPNYPDLLWRGIGLYTVHPQEGEIIRLGNGMESMIQKNPKKLRFELTRLLIQAWAPCELQKDLQLSSWASNFWGPAMQCLGLAAVDCRSGEYSESTWAISSALASRLSPQTCSIAALSDDSTHQCLNQAFSLAQETAWLNSR